MRHKNFTIIIIMINWKMKVKFGIMDKWSLIRELETYGLGLKYSDLDKKMKVSEFHWQVVA